MSIIKSAVLGNNLAEGMQAIYGEKYKDIKLSREEMELMALGFAAQWDINNKGEVQQGTIDALESFADRIKADYALMSGFPCTVNRRGDLYFEYESREFIDAECVIVKKTKSGLIQVALKDNPKRVYSVPQRNITLRLGERQ